MKNNFEPLISVIIPTFERPSLSIRALKSVLSQSYSNYEVIVINDGSKSDYSELESFIHPIENINYIKSENLGVSAARNLGIKECRGEYIAFLDSDDVWTTDKLTEQINFLRNKEEFRIVHTRENWIRNGKNINTPEYLLPSGGDIFIQSLSRCSISPSTVLIERSVFDEYGLFDEKLRVCEDYDLWLRITAYLKVGYIDKELVSKYSGPNLQLSKSEEAFDRFRVYALIKFLINNKKYPKILEVTEVLMSKFNILLNGAKKRNNNIEIEIYEYLISKIDNLDSSVLNENILNNLLVSKYNKDYTNPNLSYE